MTRKDAIKKIRKNHRKELLEDFKYWCTETLPIILIGLSVIIVMLAVIMWPIIVQQVQIHKYGNAKRWTDIAMLISIIFWSLVTFLPLAIAGIRDICQEKKKRFEDDINYELAWASRKERLLPQVPEKLKILGYVEGENCDILDIWVHDRYEIVNLTIKPYDRDYSHQITLNFAEENE